MKVLVVDDHVLIREALRGVLKQLKEDATVLERQSQAMRPIINTRPSPSFYA